MKFLERSEVRQAVLAQMRQPTYRPLSVAQLSKVLALRGEERRTLQEALTSMARRGEILALHNGRFALPVRSEKGLISGRLEIHRGGSAHLITSDPAAADIFIRQDQMGTAMHGDTVEVRTRSRESRGGFVKDVRVEGRVERVLVRATSTMVGVLQRGARKALYVIAEDARFPHPVRVVSGKRTLERPPIIGDKVVVELAPWENPNEEPTGAIVEVLGAAHAPGVDMLSIVRRYDLRPEFPEDVQREASDIPERLRQSDLEGREDLRGQAAISIDPDDARDFDDAIHVERLMSKGKPLGWRLSVHIADVAHYVAPGTALEREARRRGNSTYLVDRVIPMLPERLSNGICSLKPGVDRLAFSAFIDFSPDGEIRSSRFAKTIIRSAARLSYRQALAMLRGGQTMPPLPPTLTKEEARGQATLAEGPPVPVDRAIAERVNVAWELAALLRRIRFANGSLDLDFPEVKIWLDAQGRAARMEKTENDISHQLIEECMLVANEVVALEIKNKLVPAIYRVHENPDPERLLEFRDFAADYGFGAGDLTNRAEVQKLLKAIQGSHEEYPVKLQFLKSLKRAMYDTRPLGHYGLAKVNYAHFTSPIRRYADLAVHRSLEFILRGGKGDGRKGGQQNGRSRVTTPGVSELAELAQHISQTERTSAEAERESVTLKKMEFFQRQINSRQPQEFSAIVVDAKFFGLLVELPEILTTGSVPVSSLPEDYYTLESGSRSFVGRRSGRRFGVGDRIKVVVSRIDIPKRQMEFALVAGAEPERAGAGKIRKPETGTFQERRKPAGRRGQAEPRGRKTNKEAGVETRRANRSEQTRWKKRLAEKPSQPSRSQEPTARQDLGQEEPTRPKRSVEVPLARDFARDAKRRGTRPVGRPGSNKKRQKQGPKGR